MITTSIKFSGVNLAGLGSNSAPLFQRIQMERLGNFAIKTVRARVAKGVGSDDSAMAPLKHGRGAEFAGRVNGRAVFRPKQGYAAWKSAHGLQPIRDLTGDGKQGGHMLDNLTVRQATETSVKMAFTARRARIKALANEKRTPWLSFSGSDEKAIVAEAQRMFKVAVERIQNQIKQRYRKAA